jgi:hypothetical protein
VRFFILVLIGFGGLQSCGSSTSSGGLNSKDAVRKAVLEHLSSRKGLDLNMEAMELDVGEMSFRANEADATVSFRPKGSQTSAMTMTYSLVREGSGWKVKPKAAGAPGSGAHGVALPERAMPPGHPPAGPPK